MLKNFKKIKNHNQLILGVSLNSNRVIILPITNLNILSIILKKIATQQCRPLLRQNTSTQTPTLIQGSKFFIVPKHGGFPNSNSHFRFRVLHSVLFYSQCDLQTLIQLCAQNAHIFFLADLGSLMQHFFQRIRKCSCNSLSLADQVVFMELCFVNICFLGNINKQSCKPWDSSRVEKIEGFLECYL